MRCYGLRVRNIVGQSVRVLLVEVIIDLIAPYLTAYCLAYLLSQCLTEHLAQFASCRHPVSKHRTSRKHHQAHCNER